MKPPMMHTATKYTLTRNAYGDYTVSTATTLPCHFRYITDHISSTNDESTDSDAMAWFEADSGVQKEDILQIDNQNFRVERVIKARKLRSSNVEFIKVELLIYGAIS